MVLKNDVLIDLFECHEIVLLIKDDFALLNMRCRLSESQPEMFQDGMLLIIEIFQVRKFNPNEVDFLFL
jgi:hypothetical protein